MTTKNTKPTVTKAQSKAALKAQAPTLLQQQKAELLALTSNKYRPVDLTKTPFLILGAEVVDSDYNPAGAIEFTIKPRGKAKGKMKMAYHEKRMEFVSFFDNGGNGEELGEFVTHQIPPKKANMAGAWIFQQCERVEEMDDDIPI